MIGRGRAFVGAGVSGGADGRGVGWDWGGGWGRGEGWGRGTR